MFKNYKGYLIYANGKVVNPRGRVIGKGMIGGYHYVNIAGKVHYVHKLVARLFNVPKCNTRIRKQVASHKDWNKVHNSTTNLVKTDKAKNIHEFWRTHNRQGSWTKPQMLIALKAVARAQLEGSPCQPVARQMAVRYGVRLTNVIQHYYKWKAGAPKGGIKYKDFINGKEAM